MIISVSYQNNNSLTMLFFNINLVNHGRLVIEYHSNSPNELTGVQDLTDSVRQVQSSWSQTRTLDQLRQLRVDQWSYR